MNLRSTIGLVLLTACSGVIEPAGPSPATPQGPDPGLPSLAAFTTSPQLRRLSRAEYQYSVEELFKQAFSGLKVPLEQSVSGHGAIAGAQKVGYADTTAFLDAAEQVAERVAPALEAQLGACTAGPCLRDWAQTFLAEAFRGPVDDEVLTRYANLLALPAAGDTRLERLKTFVLAALDSPHFLYRKELGTLAQGGAVRSLSGPELASRLSYLVWQSPPDAELRSAAAAGTLADPAVREAQLTRLLADPRANRGLRAFVRDWMALQENKVQSKTAATLLGTSDTFPLDAEASVELLIDDVVVRAGGTFAELLSTDRAYVNASLAPVLGLTSASASFERVQLTDGKRLGLLGQPLVLAAHSKESGVSPFILGKFILENVTCEEVGNPPAVFPSVDEVPGSAKTLRQDLEERTAGPACIGCHKRIGPVGFAFLPYDPIGRHRPADGAARPFDTKGTLTFERSKAQISFADAPELAANLSKAEDLHKCVARRMFRFAHGRFEGPSEEPKLLELEATAVDTKTLAARLLREVVAADAFSRVPVKAQ